MTLVRFEPLKELETLHDRIQRYFEDFANFGFSFTDNFNPRIDISEDDNNINVVAEIPGVKKEDLKITLQDNILTIEGEKKKEEERTKNGKYFKPLLAIIVVLIIACLSLSYVCADLYKNNADFSS